MKVKCSYPGCKTGEFKERTYNKLHNIRNKTLFSCPRDEYKLRHWELIIGTHLEPFSVLCEEHFNKDDIISVPYHSFKDPGKVTMRSRLKPSALPMKIKDPLALDNDNESILRQRLSKSKVESSVSPTQSPPKKIRKISSETPGNSVIIKEEPTEELDETEVKTKESPILAPEVLIKSEPDEEDSNNSKLIDVDKSELAFHNIKQMLKTHSLPNGWSWAIVNKAIIIAFWDLNFESVRKFIIRDSKVQVYIKGIATPVPGITTEIKTFSDILNNILCIQKLLLCDGTGLGEHSDNCVFYIVPQKNVKHKKIVCTPCFKHRQRLLDQEKKRRLSLVRNK